MFNMSRMVREKRSPNNFKLFNKFKRHGKVQAVGCGSSTIIGERIFSTVKLEIYKEKQFEIIKFKLLKSKNDEMYFRREIKCDGNVDFNNFYESMIERLELTEFRFISIE